jgi:hypothetical protein
MTHVGTAVYSYAVGGDVDMVWHSCVLDMFEKSALHNAPRVNHAYCFKPLSACGAAQVMGVPGRGLFVQWSNGR